MVVLDHYSTMCVELKPLHILRDNIKFQYQSSSSYHKIIPVNHQPES